MAKDKIMIVGGYGAVGRVIATRLAEKFPGQVIVAGRNYDKANELSQATQGKVLPLALDVFNAHNTPEVLDGVSLVVMCLDQPDTRFVEMCLRNGVDYVDVTATYDFIVQVEALAEVAKAGGSTAVLSVGLAPGMTNLLARYAQSQFDDLQRLDIYALLGLGEVHGEAAVRWTVENLNATFTVQENGETRQVKSFEDGKQTVFPGKLGKRTAYRFDFSDQHVLPRTLGVNSVSMRLAFDSALATHLMAFYKKIGLFGLLRYRWAQDALVKLLMSFHFGSEIYVIQVDALGRVNGQIQEHSFAVTGEREARGTGLVVAEVATRLMTDDLPPGVFHIEQLFAPLSLINALENDDLQFHQSANRGVVSA